MYHFSCQLDCPSCDEIVRLLARRLCASPTASVKMTAISIASLLLFVLSFTLHAHALTDPRLRGTVTVSTAPYPYTDIVFSPLTRLHAFHATNPSEASCSSPYASWMADNLPLLANQTLLTLTLPGTHDSGAYALTNDLGPFSTGSAFWDAIIELEAKWGWPIADVLMPWSLSQRVDVTGQLCMGARYLDVRAAWNGSEWRVYHGLLGVTVGEVLGDVARFLSQQKVEVVVVEVSHLQAVDGINITAQAVAQLNATITSTLGGLLYLPPTPSFTLHTISQLIAMNQRVVVSVSSSDLPFPLDQLPFVTPFGASALFNTYADTPDLATMQRYDLLTLAAYVLPSPSPATAPLRKLSYTLTPDGDTVLDWWLPGHPTSLKELAAVANGVLSSDGSVGGWRREGLLSASGSGGSSVGGSGVIVLMDWFDTRLVEECIWALKHNRTAHSATTATAAE